MTRKNAGLLDDIGMRMNYHISAEEFALVWYSCSTPMEVAEQLGLPYGPMMMRVSRYRRAGIRLKRIPRKNERRVDVEGINKAEGKAFLDEALLLTRLSGLSVFEQAPSALRQDDGLVGQEMTAHGPEALGEADSGTG